MILPPLNNKATESTAGNERTHIKPESEYNLIHASIGSEIKEDLGENNAS